MHVVSRGRAMHVACGSFVTCFFANRLLSREEVRGNNVHVGTSILKLSDLHPRPFWEFLR